MLRRTLAFSFLFVLTSSRALAEYGGAQCEEGSASKPWSFRCEYKNLVEFVYDQPTSSPGKQPAVSDFICNRGVKSVCSPKVEFWHYSPFKNFTYELNAAIYNPDIMYSVLSKDLASEDTGWALSGAIDLRNIVENENIQSSNKLDLAAIGAVVKGRRGKDVLLPVLIGALDAKSPCRTLSLGLFFPSDLSNASFTLTGPIPDLKGTGQTRMESSIPKVLGGATLRWDQGDLNLAGRGWYKLTVKGFSGSGMKLSSFSYLLFVPYLR
ncbi:MAG: hypothetical protein OXJ64_05130 [Boseongicola sp.]|nr:hypothetical protein [Boseongicola sp.]